MKLLLPTILLLFAVACGNAENNQESTNEVNSATQIPPAKQNDLQREYLIGNVRVCYDYAIQAATQDSNGNWVTEKGEYDHYDIFIYKVDGYRNYGYKIFNDTFAHYEYKYKEDTTYLTAYQIDYSNGVRTSKAVGGTRFYFSDDYTSVTDNYYFQGNDSILTAQYINALEIISKNEKKFTSTTINYEDKKVISQEHNEGLETRIGDTLISSSKNSIMKFIKMEKDSIGNVTKLLVLDYKGTDNPIATIKTFSYEYYDNQK